MISHLFPHPSLADSDGLLCYGGNLNVETLLEAYSYGIFPWFSEGEASLWWSPNPRFVLFPEDLCFSSRADKRIRAMDFEIGIDGYFSEVIGQCAKIARKDGGGTWILPEVKCKGLMSDFLKRDTRTVSRFLKKGSLWVDFMV